MEILRSTKKLCTCCMEEHEVQTVRIRDRNIFKGQQVEYDAVYEYCNLADEYFAVETEITENDMSLKEAYRKQNGLLTSREISEIRLKYGISQADLCTLLGWGGKTITRYEGHQVQDAAHDMILRKLDADPEWFLELLKSRKDIFSRAIYYKYKLTAAALYEKALDDYLRKSINARYAIFETDSEYCGGTLLDLDRVIEVINYFAQSHSVTALFKVKLMKMLWYADALSFKRSGHSMTGLVYVAMPMGAVPVEHKSIIELKGISYNEIDFGDGSGYLFTADPDSKGVNLNEEEKSVLDTVIAVCGKDTKQEIIERMHGETAYKMTPAGKLISYKYANELSIA